MRSRRAPDTLALTLALALAAGTAAGADARDTPPAAPERSAHPWTGTRSDPRDLLLATAHSLAIPFPRAAADSDTTSLDDYVEDMADSTDLYFGLSVAPVDTAGLDSALAYGLLHPEDQPRQPRGQLGVGPLLGFNRVEGPVWGGFATIGDVRDYGLLRGELQYAVGPNAWKGGGRYRKTWPGRRARWSTEMWGGRTVFTMDRDRTERILAALRAFVIGKDRKHYMLREGFEVQLERESRTMRLGVSYRDMLESPLVTTTTWNLAQQDLSVIENLPATPGRVREVGFEAGLRLPLVPVILQLSHHNASEQIGSELDYRRTRASASGEWGLGSFATLIPQATYGRIPGTPAPQAAYYMGGTHSVRSISSASRGGTAHALGRIDLVGAHDILALARIPHPAAVPIQLGLFAASGAVWGPDPYGGPAYAGEYWPEDAAWVHEAGVSFHYQPGIPDPEYFMRVSFSWPLGPGREVTRWSLSYTRAIDLVTPFSFD